MPRYRVLKPAFLDNTLYGPDSKRPVYVTDKPFPKGKQPKWLELIGSEEKAPKSTGKGRSDKEDEKAKQEDEQREEGMTFLAGEGAPNPGSHIETL